MPLLAAKEGVTQAVHIRLEMVKKADVGTCSVSVPSEVLSDVRKILLLNRSLKNTHCEWKASVLDFFPRKLKHTCSLTHCALKVETFIERVLMVRFACAAGIKSCVH